MNIRVNEKFIAILVTAAMGFTLCSCAKEDEIITDGINFDDAIESVEDNTLTDEVLDYATIDIVNPFSLEYLDTIKLIDAANYLENTLEISQKLSMMREIPVLPPDDPNYFMVEEVADWSDEEIYELIDNYIYNDDKEKRVEDGTKLSYCKTYFDRELRVNGINIATALLESSIKSKILDAYKGEVEDISTISIYGNSVFYNDNKLLFNNEYELNLLDNLYNIYYNRDEFNDLVDFEGVNSVLNETLNVTKDVIVNEFVLEKNKVKSI